MAAAVSTDDCITASSSSSAGTTLPVEPALALDNNVAFELVGEKPQDAAQEKHTIIMQEGAAMDPSSVDYRRRVRQLKRDVRSSKIKSPRNSTYGMFKAMCSTDLLFLIDTTASMMGHINAAKTQVRNIIDGVMDAFFGDAEIRVAVVGYKVSKWIRALVLNLSKSHVVLVINLIIPPVLIERGTVATTHLIRRTTETSPTFNISTS